ncbi:MAG: GNAT family N-acetyltransferase [Planctomycetota bacterium]
MSRSPASLRPVVPSGLDAILALWNATAAWDPCEASVLREKIFEDDAVAPELRLGAFIGEELVGLGVAATHASRGYIKLLSVAPASRRRGIGAQLLAQLEERLQTYGLQVIRVAESAPNYLTPGVDQRNQEALQFFQRQGYRSIGTAYNQEVNLTQRDWDTTSDESDTWEAHAIRIRRAAGSDRESIQLLLTDHWPSWRAEVSRSLSADVPAVHVAVAEGQVIAFAAYDGNNVGSGWFGPMGTAPSHTGKGLGRILLHRCLGDMRDQGRQTATIPWVGPLSFYEQHAGATLDRTFTRFEKTL